MPVILSELPARLFRPAGFVGRAGAQSKDLLLPDFSMTLGIVNSRSLDSARRIKPRTGLMRSWAGPSLGMTAPRCWRS
jgi:hypothetical protein